MAGVKRGRGRGRGNLGARERVWSGALRRLGQGGGGVMKSYIKAMYCSCLKKTAVTLRSSPLGTFRRLAI